jgi:hypothetical protein
VRLALQQNQTGVSMKALCLIVLFCLAAPLAHAQTPRLMIPAGLSYTKVNYRDTQGELFKSLFGPQPDVVGTYSVASISSGIFYVSQSGFGAKGDLAIGRLSQSGMHFDASDPRWSALIAGNGLYAVIDHLIITAGLHANSLYQTNGKNSYLGFGLQAGIGVYIQDFLLQVERFSDSEVVFDLFGGGHTELKTTKITLSYMFSLI